MGVCIQRLTAHRTPAQLPHPPGKLLLCLHPHAIFAHHSSDAASVLPFFLAAAASMDLLASYGLADVYASLCGPGAKVLTESFLDVVEDLPGNNDIGAAVPATRSVRLSVSSAPAICRLVRVLQDIAIAAAVIAFARPSPPPFSPFSRSSSRSNFRRKTKSSTSRIYICSCALVQIHPGTRADTCRTTTNAICHSRTHKLYLSLTHAHINACCHSRAHT